MVSVWPNAHVVHVCMCWETFFDTAFPHSSFTIWVCAVEESLLHLLLLNTCSCTISLPHVAFSTLNNLCKEKKKKQCLFLFRSLMFLCIFLNVFLCIQCTVAVLHLRNRILVFYCMKKMRDTEGAEENRPYIHSYVPTFIKAPSIDCVKTSG